ncbi:DEAD/DEAH box helicase [Nocardia grenadensis]|uniref:DEAD/DEAH box helicase n=1 Tax=Nocardia grenadensis TaxID=931537 RepID=UPI000A00DEB8|nr:DEAD/DEAH box helicase [Nocardia grenadensis]
MPDRFSPETGSPAHPRAGAARTPPPFTELGLPVLTVQALRREGLTDPLPIQAAAVPDALAGRDVLGRAPTGSGKTLAFGLPMLARLAGAPAIARAPRGLILAPTRELALQIEQALEPFALGLRLGTAVGGIPVSRQAAKLQRGVDLLIATPGRLADLVDQGAAVLDAVRVTTVDEADHMADFGFLPQVRRLLDLVPGDGQRMLFSATLDDESVRDLVRRYLRDPVTHTVAAEPATAPATHHILYVEPADKPAVLAEIAARDGRTLLFARTQYGAEKLTRRLRDQGIRVAALHGGKAQNRRIRTLAAFADGGISALVATDIAARGIHVDAVSLVVHADPPADAKDYVHRAGRTARAGASGTVITVVTPDQRAEMAALTRAAEVPVVEHTVRPGDREVRRLTGARTPPGPEAAKLPEVPPVAARGHFRGQSGRGRGGAAKPAPSRRPHRPRRAK